MNRSLAKSLSLLAAIAVAFVLGLVVAPEGATAEAQGRGVRPPPKDDADDSGKTVSTPLVFDGGGGSSAAANGFIAVSGSYAVGSSVLYVLDTNNKQLAVYEARGGSPGSRKLFLVGARRIDLDLQLYGYNDESQFDYDSLRRTFEANAKKASASTPVVERGASDRDAAPAGSSKK
jgi:hypothetical protein